MDANLSYISVAPMHWDHGGEFRGRALFVGTVVVSLLGATLLPLLIAGGLRRLRPIQWRVVLGILLAAVMTHSLFAMDVARLRLAGTGPIVSSSAGSISLGVTTGASKEATDFGWRSRSFGSVQFKPFQFHAGREWLSQKWDVPASHSLSAPWWLPLLLLSWPGLRRLFGRRQ